VILLKFMNGEFDLFGRYSAIDMYPTLKAEEKKGKFKVYVCGPERGPAIYLNWDCPNSALREALRNKQVRIALSQAINRQEISQIVFKGMLDPSGYSFAPSSPYFDEAAYRRYTEYDPQKARRLLEKAGYRDTDGDGWRELTDGSRFELTVDIVAPGQDQDVCELVASHWREVGVKLNLNAALRDIIWPRRIAGSFEAHIWMLEAPADPLGRLYDWAMVGQAGPFWHRKAPQTAQPWFRQASRYFREAMYTVDPDKLRELMVKARDLHSENVPVIVIGSVYHVWGANTRLGNVPTEGTTADVFRGWGRPVFHEQLFIKPR